MSLAFQKVLIKGDMVQLRPIRTEDAYIAYDMVRDNEILKWLLWDGPKSKDEIVNTYKQWEIEFGNNRDCRFAIEKIIEPGIIGCIGLNRQDYPEKAELGYWLSKKHWDSGYMSDAVHLVCYLAFKYLGLIKVYSPVFIGNNRSRRVLEKNGFSLEGKLRSHFKKRGKYRDVWYMSLLKSDWEKIESRQFPSFEDVAVGEIE